MEVGFNLVGESNEFIYIQDRLSEDDISKILEYKECTTITFWYVKHPDLAFLGEMTNLTKVLLYSSKIEDFGILSTLKNLKELCINGIKNQEDLAFLSNITQIESLQLLYLPKLEKFPNLSQTKLKKLQIWHCKRLIDIQNITQITSLEELRILGTPHKPEDLEFLMKIDHLQYIAAEFGSNKANKIFDDMLIKYNKKRNKPKMHNNRIYVDFNEMIEDDLVLLSQKDVILNFGGKEVLLFEGLKVDVYTDDRDENDLPDFLIASGIVERNNTGAAPVCKWNCRIDANGIRHESEVGRKK